MKNNMTAFRKLLDLVKFGVRADYSFYAEFVVECVGLFRTADESGNVEGVAAGMI